MDLKEKPQQQPDTKPITSFFTTARAVAGASTGGLPISASTGGGRGGGDHTRLLPLQSKTSGILVHHLNSPQSLLECVEARNTQ